MLEVFGLGRRLTNSQWEHVIQQASVEPTALYLTLAVRTVQHWTSYDSRSHVWKRLRGALEGLVVERTGVYQSWYQTVARDSGEEI